MDLAAFRTNPGYPAPPADPSGAQAAPWGGTHAGIGAMGPVPARIGRRAKLPFDIGASRRMCVWMAVDQGRRSLTRLTNSIGHSSIMTRE